MSGSVKKDGNIWYYVLELGKDPKTGRRKQKKKRGFKTKKEAQAALIEAQNDVIKGTYVESSKMLFEDYLLKWLEDKKTKIQESTYGTYKWLVQKYIIGILGKIEVSKITPMHLQSFYNELINDSRLANENVRKIHSLINNALKRAEKWGIISRNIAPLVERPKSSKRELQIWNLKQVNLFLDTAKTDRLYLAFLLAITTGMRQSEILGLRWKDIDIEENTLSVTQSLSHDGKKLLVGTKTTAGIRKIHIDQQTIEIIKKHRRIIENEKKHFAGIYEDNGLVISTCFGTPVIPRNLMRTFYRLINDAGLPRIRFHDLRHTHATLLLKQGVNPKIVAERLGHADVRITLDTYSHLLPSLQQETAKQFGEMLYASTK